MDKDGRRVSEKNWKVRETGQIHVAQKGEIYPYGYDPTFYPHRLNEPRTVRRPHRIFVVDTGDLFGNWVPREWIELVVHIVRACPQHTFMFLTKNPARLMEFDFPPNAWVGTSINNNMDKEKVEIIKKVKSSIRFISIEPLLEKIEMDFLGIQWLIIGAQTGKNPVKPQPVWIDKILQQAENLHIPVFMKNNLKPYCRIAIQQLPYTALIVIPSKPKL